MGGFVDLLGDVGVDVLSVGLLLLLLFLVAAEALAADYVFGSGGLSVEGVELGGVGDFSSK